MRRYTSIGPSILSLTLFLERIGIFLASILAVRFLLKLVGASPFATGPGVLYSMTDPWVAPIENIFGKTQFSATPQLELTTLIAILVYWMLIAGIIETMKAAAMRARARAEATAAFRIQRRRRFNN